MLSDNEFRSLLDHLNRPWAGYRKVRRGGKKRRRRHMLELGCMTIDPYIARLARRPDEMAVCENCLRVTISRFFRDRELWSALQAHILPGLVERFAPPIRAWSAGCACGEEPYSLAMVWNQRAPLPALELLATDVDSICLERARAGAYARSSLKEVPDEIRKKYFEAKKGGRKFLIRSHRLPSIRWLQQDLTGLPPEGGPFHMILMRNNLLTYYQGAEQYDAFARIVSSLAAGGCLVIGAHERLPACCERLIKDENCRLAYWLE